MRNLKVLLAVCAVLSMWGCGYNDIPRGEELIKAAWADVEVQYQRRAELVPNLIEVVRAYGEYEQETLLLITKARTGVAETPSPSSFRDAEAMREYEQAQASLGSALRSLKITLENYPDLKANRNYLQLMSQLEGTENRIALARSQFNRAVADYNIEFATIPGKWWAAIFFSDKAPVDSYFESTVENADVAPVVEL